MKDNSSKLPYRARRLLALMKGKENIDDFGEPDTYTIYCVSRDCFIHCNSNNIGYYFENMNDDRDVTKQQRIIA